MYRKNSTKMVPHIIFCNLLSNVLRDLHITAYARVQGWGTMRDL